MLRRAFIAGATLAPAMSLARTDDLASRCIAAIRGALDAIPPGPALLHSYLVNAGADAGDFDLTQADAAYVYDNALAIAQAHDRFWKDSRLRNAYQAGPMAQPAKLPGWWDAKAATWREDPYQAGSQTGPVAWAMLLWAALGNTEPANRAADWLNRQMRAQNGYFGGFYGFEPAPLKLTWQSTEQNTDLFAAYAQNFVRAMFDPQRVLFNAGTASDGSANPLLAADAGTWPYLAGLGNAKSAANTIAGLRRGTGLNGIGFSAASTSVWPEGTAFAALALRRQNNPLAADFLATVGQQLSPSGFVYAAIADRLATGLNVGPPPPGQPPLAFEYFRRPALAPTAWAALSALNVNPLAT
jgi:hypothetical protein